MGGSITVEEQNQLQNYLEGRSVDRVKKQMKEIWLQRDEDHSGFLERSEISAFFDLIIHNLGENGVVFKKDAKELVAEWTKMCDFNTDKRLSWDEFSYGLLGLIYPQLPPKVVGEEDKSPFIRSKIFFGDVQNRLKAFPDDEPLVEKWDHFELNPKIVGIKKLVITAGGFVDGFQVDYILDDGSIWSSPTHGKTDADNSREILFDENEFIVAIDGREGWWGIINQIALTIEKKTSRWIKNTTSRRTIRYWWWTSIFNYFFFACDCSLWIFS
jgi:hypothetical protein